MADAGNAASLGTPPIIEGVAIHDVDFSLVQNNQVGLVQVQLNTVVRIFLTLRHCFEILPTPSGFCLLRGCTKTTRKIDSFLNMREGRLVMLPSLRSWLGSGTAAKADETYHHRR